MPKDIQVGDIARAWGRRTYGKVVKIEPHPAHNKAQFDSLYIRVKRFKEPYTAPRYQVESIEATQARMEKALKRAQSRLEYLAAAKAALESWTPPELKIEPMTTITIHE